MKLVAEKDEEAPSQEAGALLLRALGDNVRRLRKGAGMTLGDLSVVSGVSRAMLSSVERAEKSPTMAVLAGIARGLDVTLSRLMDEETAPAAATVIRRDQRLVFKDPVTAIERHLLSPTHIATGVEVIEHVLPPGEAFPGGPQSGRTTDKYVVVREGVLTVEFGRARYVLGCEDSAYFRVTGPYCFINEGDVSTRYYIFITHRD